MNDHLRLSMLRQELTEFKGHNKELRKSLFDLISETEEKSCELEHKSCELEHMLEGQEGELSQLEDKVDDYDPSGRTARDEPPTPITVEQAQKIIDDNRCPPESGSTSYDGQRAVDMARINELNKSYYTTDNNYKTCPQCSVREGVLVYLPYPEMFATNGLGGSGNDAQSWCHYCRRGR